MSWCSKSFLVGVQKSNKAIRDNVFFVEIHMLRHQGFVVIPLQHYLQEHSGSRKECNYNLRIRNPKLQVYMRGDVKHT